MAHHKAIIVFFFNLSDESTKSGRAEQDLSDIAAIVWWNVMQGQNIPHDKLKSATVSSSTDYLTAILTVLLHPIRLFISC